MSIDTQRNKFKSRKKCTKTPRSLVSPFCRAINQSPAITYFTVIATFTIFFNLKMHPIYHEMLSKDSFKFILFGRLQPKSIPHLVQQAESHDIIGKGGGIISFLRLCQYCFFSSRTDHPRQVEYCSKRSDTLSGRLRSRCHHLHTKPHIVG